MRRHPALLIPVLLAALVMGLDANRPDVATTVLDAWPAVARTFRDAVSRAGIVGSALVFVHGSRVLAIETVGLADRETARPVAPDTIFHWASITKTFTGIAIMQLRDRGRLTLDDPVVDHVPELARIHNPFGPVRQITIRHLMSHSAGFRASTWPWGGDKPWHPFEPTEWAQIVAMLPYTEVLFAPGSQYRYSNPGIIFLGRIIERLSGDDYETYVTKNILSPLQMHRSFFDRAPYHLLPARSHSYIRADGHLREAAFDFDTGITVSNGGLNAPVSDMATYLAFLTGDPARQQAFDRILARASLDEMWTPVIRAAAGEGVSGADSHATLSFFAERHAGVDIVGHSGNQNGFLSHLYVHRPTQTGYVVAYNTDASTSAPAARSLTREADDEIRDAIVTQVWKKM